MGGILSEAMVMCACTTDGYETTEFIDPPTAAYRGNQSHSTDIHTNRINK